MGKIKEFFKRFWYLGLVPIGAFILHLFMGSRKKDKSLEKKIKKDIKETQEDIKQTTEEIKEEENSIKENVSEVKENLEKVEDSIEKVEEIIEEDMKDKAVRDEKASNYLPNL